MQHWNSQELGGWLSIKILVLSWEYPPRIVGGLGRHVYELCTSLSSLGQEVTVITCGDSNTKEKETIGGVDVIRVNSPTISGQDFLTWVMGLNFAMVEKAIDVITKGRDFDIIHAHDWLVAFAAETIKKAYHIPLVSTIHATEWGRNKGLHNDVQRYISSVEWRLAYESWRVICCSHFMMDELKNVLGLPEDKLRLIPNGVRREEFQVSYTGPEGQDEFKLRYAARSEKIVFYIGRLVHEKGVDTLVDCVPHVLNQYNDVKFIIAGTGPSSESIKSRARHLGVANRVYFTGFVDDTTRTRLMKLADVAVFPSLYEPFGIVALEAMAAGRPVVVSDVGGLSEIITQGVNGLKAYPGDAVSLANSIIEMLRNPEKAVAMAEQAHQDTITIYNWDNIAVRTAQVYNEVMEDSADTPWVRQMRPYLQKNESAGLADFVGMSFGSEMREVRV